MSANISGLTKYFANQAALKNLSLNFNSDERILLLGANGSGKSTLLRCIAGTSKASEGKITSSFSFSYLSQSLQLYSALSAVENLEFFASLSGNLSLIDMDYWDLQSLKNTEITKLSMGQKQRVHLCNFFTSGKAFHLLDEPTTYLDIKGIELVREKLSSAKNGFILASHDIENLSGLANRAILLEQGQLKMDSNSVSEVIDTYRRINK